MTEQSIEWRLKKFIYKTEKRMSVNFYSVFDGEKRMRVAQTEKNERTPERNHIIKKEHT